MATHTPGPWTFGTGEQFGDTRFYISQQEGAPYTPDFSDVCSLIAETLSGERVTVQTANARLIAAAPELLAALQALLPFTDDVQDDGPTGYGWKSDELNAARNAAAEAIEKATGVSA